VHPFESFLQDFVPELEKKSRRLNQVLWIMETTGSKDAAGLKADLDTEYRLLFNDESIYQKLLEWEKNPPESPELKRQLKILLFSFKENMCPKEILKKIASKEAEVGLAYACFRPKLDGKEISENELREKMKSEEDPSKRKEIWEVSKDIGKELAKPILELVNLRNEGAKALGYSDYFQMQLGLQEVDGKWLMDTLDELATKSDAAYSKVAEKIESELSERFHVSREELGPWAWSEPFCQEDPLDSKVLDDLVKDVDILKSSHSFFHEMGFDVNPILDRSDMYEREGKNQHAFCINIDRRDDIRTLNNVKPSIKWYETVLHELGHAVYEVGFDDKLPWLLRAPPHMIPTEAMALICGRQAYKKHFLENVVKDQNLMDKAEESLKRRQLIFSRWVLVMTHFEAELYRDPTQDLNKLWWDLVQRFQKVKAPKNREGAMDWAAKYHIGLAPVYYFSYLLGEMFASGIQKNIEEKTGKEILNQKEVGEYLRTKLFAPGALLSWDKLIEHTLDEPLSPNAWLEEFA